MPIAGGRSGSTAAHQQPTIAEREQRLTAPLLRAVVMLAQDLAAGRSPDVFLQDLAHRTLSSQNRSVRSQRRQQLHDLLAGRISGLRAVGRRHQLQSRRRESGGFDQRPAFHQRDGKRSGKGIAGSGRIDHPKGNRPNAPPPVVLGDEAAACAQFQTDRADALRAQPIRSLCRRTPTGWPTPTRVRPVWTG
jgi:hypothetical protein